jgi:beta-glucosidase
MLKFASRLQSPLNLKGQGGPAKISPGKTLKFPDQFHWGIATSAFQIEGHPDEINDRLSDWSVWTTKEGKISDLSTADQACEFYSRYPEDIALCRSLNLDAFRLSLNWPALCPKEQETISFDKEAVDYYRNLLSALKAQGFTTFVTLFHFCTPRWLSDIGGWTNPRTAVEFAKYAALAAKEFGDLVDYWITHNEPLVYAYYGYIAGEWPPGHKGNYFQAFKCIRHLLEAHALAYKEIKTQHPNSQISFAMHWRPFKARHRFSFFDNLSRYLRDFIFNQLFPLSVEKGELIFPFPLNLAAEVKHLQGPIPHLKGAFDYIAINYYTREICEFKWQWPLDPFGGASDHVEFESSDLGWELYPEGLYYLLTEDMAPFRYNKDGSLRKIFITENGMATMHSADLDAGDWSLDDDQRIRYLISHLVALHRAIADGANVKGYLYWSLLDNFEWAQGLKPRFGLVRVAYPTQERTMRKSAAIYADIAKTNSVDADLLHLEVHSKGRADE